MLPSTAETEALAIKIKRARDALIPLRYQLLDHQRVLECKSRYKWILSVEVRDILQTCWIYKVYNLPYYFCNLPQLSPFFCWLLQIPTLNLPPEDETSIRLRSIMANVDTTISREEEEIKNFTALISPLNDEVGNYCLNDYLQYFSLSVDLN